MSLARFAAAADKEVDADAEARKQLVGVWKGSVENGAKGHELTFTVDDIAGLQDGKKDLGAGTFTLDLSKTPCCMDAKGTKRPQDGKTYLGIYSLEGDTLKWCVAASGKDRPTKFATGNGNFCLVLQRQKKEK